MSELPPYDEPLCELWAAYRALYLRRSQRPAGLSAFMEEEVTAREPTEMEIRVAKALVKTACEESGVTLRPEDHPLWVQYLPMARAVIRAMREPTRAQYDALCALDKQWGEFTSLVVWQTYIDAASPP